MKKIKTALISVFNKEGLELIIKALDRLDVTLYSTGGTHQFILNQGVNVTGVEEVTDYPSILGGRVKTLHPKIFGGVLARRERDSAEIEKLGVTPFDLVVVDLYPFSKTFEEGAEHQEIIEKIDIGGISLIRAAAKNYRDVLIVPSRSHYSSLLDILENREGKSGLDERKAFAAKAYDISSSYDTAIFNYLNGEERTALKINVTEGRSLRYGENPHQKGYYFGRLEDYLKQLHGKALSYNNLVDIDAAVALTSGLDKKSFVVIKHTNPCGVATREELSQAWKDALAGDPVSAFGGILSANEKIDKATAEEIHKLFFEVIIAPGYDEDALEILKQKKKRIVLLQTKNVKRTGQVRSVLDGYLWQDWDQVTERKNDLKTVTNRAPGDHEVNDLLFAGKIVKHAKSNAIVLVKDRQLIGIGQGQTSRVEALKQSIDKAKNFEFDLNGAVMASDAFFPFADSVELAYSEGITAVIQPGGSIRDKESVDFCDQHDIAMVFTGTRHFKH